MFAAQNFHLLASFSNLISVIVPIAVIDDLLAAYIFCNFLDQTIKKDWDKEDDEDKVEE